MLKVRTLLLSLLGLVYTALAIGVILVIWGVLAFAAPLIAGFLGARLSLFRDLMNVVNSLRKKPYPVIEGVSMTPRNAPALHTELNKIRKRVCSPKIHEIVFAFAPDSTRFVQTERFRRTPLHRGVLVIATPAMHILSVDQFRWLVATHLSAHGGIYGRLRYRMWSLWHRYNLAFAALGDAIKEERLVGVAFQEFFEWFVPRLRTDLEALDSAAWIAGKQTAADLAGSEVAANAQAALAAKEEYLVGSFWPKIQALAPGQQSPPGDILQMMFSDLDTSDPAPPTTNALTFFLADYIDQVLTVLNQQWRSEAAPLWTRSYETAQEARAGLIALEKQSEPLSTGERWQRIQWKQSLDGTESVRDECSEFVKEYPDHTHGQALIGLMLLNEDDPAGIEHVEKAIAGDSYYARWGRDEIVAFYNRNGHAEKANAYLVQLQRQEFLSTERRVIREGDLCRRIELSELQFDQLRRELEQCSPVSAAYMIVKTTKEPFEESFPFLVVVIPAGKSVFNLVAIADVEQKIRTCVQLPPDTSIVVVDPRLREQARLLDSLKDARVFGDPVRKPK